MELYINGEPQFHWNGKEKGTHPVKVKCCECGKELTLKFPNEFEGHSVASYESIRSYVDFLKQIKHDYSYGCFCWSKGKEVWLCPECNSGTIWLAKDEVDMTGRGHKTWL